jgi:hypothetical protein
MADGKWQMADGGLLIPHSELVIDPLWGQGSQAVDHGVSAGLA